MSISLIIKFTDLYLINNFRRFLLSALLRRDEVPTTIVAIIGNWRINQGNRIEDFRGYSETNQVVAKEYRPEHYECEDYNEKVVASHLDCPKEGVSARTSWFR